MNKCLIYCLLEVLDVGGNESIEEISKKLKDKSLLKYLEEKYSYSYIKTLGNVDFKKLSRYYESQIENDTYKTKIANYNNGLILLIAVIVNN